MKAKRVILNIVKLKIFWFGSIIWIFTTYICSCQTISEEKQESHKDIVGYWKSYVASDKTKKDPGLHKIIVDSNGMLMQSVIYESTTQCRIWINDYRISFANGHLEFWGDEFKGEMSDDKNSINLKYNNQIPFIWERVQDVKTIKFLDSLEASKGKNYSYHAPEKTDDGWECSSLEDVGIKKEKIVKCVDRIRDGKYKDIHSLLIVKDGKLVLEEYFGAEGKLWSPFFNNVLRERIQIQASVTKSVNSALIGIAKDQGFIKELNDPASEWFTEYSDLINENKKDITIKHLLTMSAGLEWNELDIPYSNPLNDTQVMNRDEDIIEFCFNKPMVSKPGEKFVYNTGLSLILGEILKKSVGVSVDKYAEENLFKQLGISKYKWVKHKKGVVATGGGLSLQARDMAKFGQLYLNNGKWKNQQILSEDWVKESIQAHIKTSSGSYGYQWWQRNFHVNFKNIESFYAIGVGGQFIFVFPRTSNGYSFNSPKL